MSAALLALTAALWVASDPSGANVYIDGRLTGQTPLSVVLQPGDHRVRLVKGGYLENSRIVTVWQLRSTNLHVTLTRGSSDVEPAPRSKSSGAKRWTWVAAAGGAAAAAGIYAVHRNHAPIGGTIIVTPAAVGMADATVFAFDSNATDKDGDDLTYDWNFGDGATGTGKTAKYIYPAAGTFNVTLRVGDGKAAPVAATGISVTVAPNLTGIWTGVDAIPFFPCGITFTATQNGSFLSGSIRFTPGTIGCSATPPIAMSAASVDPLTYPTTVTWTSEPFSFAFLPGPLVIPDLSVRFTGTTNVAGNSVIGSFQVVRAGTVVVTSSLTFRR